MLDYLDISLEGILHFTYLVKNPLDVILEASLEVTSGGA